GYDVIVTSGEFDVAKQQDQVKDFIVKKVTAIVLTPCDSKSIGPAIKEANEAGIPVFTADIACMAPGAKVVSHIATDNFGGGKLAAVALVEALSKRGEAKGEIAIIDHPEVESVIMRTRGFKEQLAEENKRPDVDLKIVKQLPGGGAQEKGQKTMQDILASNREVKGVFAINDPSALGAVAALEAAKKLDQVVVIGFDGQPTGKQAIKEGRIYADPIQFPDRIGRRTVQAVLDHLAGRELPAEILIPTALYRKADAEKDPSLK
ncbi:MAG: substrate-binding domain-containing protein, partial [Phycisphaerae bacterium]